MKIILLLLIATALHAQQAEPVKPAPPASVTIRIVADGVTSKYDVKPEAIEVLNNLLHAQRFTGAFGDRYVAWLRAVVKDLAKREEFAPTAAKAKLDAVKTAQAAVETEAANIADERK